MKKCESPDFEDMDLYYSSEGHNPEYIKAVNGKIRNIREESRAITDELLSDIGLNLIKHVFDSPLYREVMENAKKYPVEKIFYRF